MTLSKQWFDDEIARWTVHKNTLNVQSADYSMTLGIISGLQIAYKELVKPPTKSESKPKDINVEKGYETILKYYIDKGYSVEDANRIAQKCMTDQQQARLSS